jgi:hypothetical protein
MPTSTDYSYISEVNSTTTTLGANATFTGISDDVSGYSEVVILAYSDVSSDSPEGLVLQFSSDNSNWDYEECYTLTGGKPLTIRSAVVAQFCRILYTNDVAAQTEFRLSTLYHKFKGSDVRINPLADDFTVKVTNDKTSEIASQTQTLHNIHHTLEDILFYLKGVAQ